MDQLQRSYPGIKVESDLRILDLPDTVALKIFANLSHPELCKIALVCKHWLWIVYDSELWKHFDLEKFHCADESHVINLIQTRLSPLLRTLNLGHYKITPLLINELTSNCRQLSTLSLQGCHWISTQEGESTFPQPSLPENLTRLDLRDFGDRGSFMHIILNNPDLSKLECFGFGNKASCMTCPTFVDFRCLLSKMANLQVLECCDSELVTDQLLQAATEALPLVQSINLKSCHKVTGSSLKGLIEKCSCLKSLILSGTSVHDNSLASVSWKDSKIEDLDLSLCDKITTAGLRLVLPNLRFLQYLCLNNCGRGKAVKDELLVEVWEKGLWADLHTLSLQFSCCLTGEGINQLKNCSNLENLSLRSCHRLGFQEVSDILHFFKKLKSVEVGTLFTSPERSICWGVLLASIPANCPLMEKIELVKCSGTTLGNLSRYRQKILQFLLHCTKLKSVCLQHCDAGISNLFSACVASLADDREIEVTTSNMTDPIIPLHKHSLDLYMKENLTFS